MYYEITYIFDGKQYSIIERPTKYFEELFPKKVLYRIESLISAGATIIDIRKGEQQ